VFDAIDERCDLCSMLLNLELPLQQLRATAKEQGSVEIRRFLSDSAAELLKEIMQPG